MKIAYLLTLASCAVLTHTSLASESGDLDHALEANLRANLRERHVHVHVKHGIVTLDGRVQTEADRERIDSLVRHTGGVVAVKDELHVTLPSPGIYGQVPAGVPVYATAPPEALPPTTIIASPAPVIVPQYPKLKVQAWTAEDQPAADGIAHELRSSAVPLSGLEDVTISIRHGNAILHGVVGSSDERATLIAAVQRAGGVRAIYDQLRTR